jgi:hypothetical protein
VRSIAEILEDPWFAEEAGRPSIAVLLRKATVGDYVFMPDHEEIWKENLTAINKDAGRADKQAIDPSIKATKGGVMEMISFATRSPAGMFQAQTSRLLIARDARQ